MKLYKLNAAEFYGPDAYGADRNIAKCEQPMREVIDRYDLKGKSVFSIGPGSAHEEYHFLHYGRCPLTFVDIDEHGVLAPRLERMARNGLAAGPTIDYYIGDFVKEHRHPLLRNVATHDVLYISGFTPDELRRNKLARPSTRLGRYLREKYFQDNYQWPIWNDLAQPFHPVIEKAVRRFLRPGGLLIVQSYCGGLDATRNPAYVRACHRQMSRIGMDVTELWCFANWRGIMLYVARKRGGDLAGPSMASPLTCFHGRADVKDPIMRIYPPVQHAQ